MVGQEERSTISEPERCYCSFAYSGLACFKDRDVGLAHLSRVRAYTTLPIPAQLVSPEPALLLLPPPYPSGREVRIDHWSTSHRSRRPPSDCRRQIPAMNSWDHHSLSFKRIPIIVPLAPNESNSERNDLQRREYRVREVHRMRTAFHDIDCRRASLWSQARVGVGRCVWSPRMHSCPVEVRCIVTKLCRAAFPHS